MKKLILAMALIGLTGVATSSFGQDGDKTKTSTTTKKSSKKKSGSSCCQGHGTTTCSDKRKTETK